MKGALTLLLMTSCTSSSSSTPGSPVQTGKRDVPASLCFHGWNVTSCVRWFLPRSSCWEGTSAFLHLPVSAAASGTLEYLLEPPVYAEVVAPRGRNVTLPCILRTRPSQYNVKWTKVEVEKAGRENVIIITDGRAWKTYGPLGRRASLRRAHVLDASLQLSRVELEDGGRYRCQLIHHLQDESVFIALRIEGTPYGTALLRLLLLTSPLFSPGVVFPYQSKNGRYRFTYDEAKRACEEQDGTLASQQQLYTGPSRLSRPAHR